MKCIQIAAFAFAASVATLAGAGSLVAPGGSQAPVGSVLNVPSLAALLNQQGNRQGIRFVPGQSVAVQGGVAEVFPNSAGGQSLIISSASIAQSLASPASVTTLTNAASGGVSTGVGGVTIYRGVLLTIDGKTSLVDIVVDSANGKVTITRSAQA